MACLCVPFVGYGHVPVQETPGGPAAELKRQYELHLRTIEPLGQLENTLMAQQIDICVT